MLIFRADIHCERPCCRAEGSTGLTIRSALERPSKVIGDGLSEVIAIGQGRPADRHGSGVDRLNASCQILFAIE